MLTIILGTTAAIEDIKQAQLKHLQGYRIDPQKIENIAAFLLVKVDTNHLEVFKLLLKLVWLT